MAESYQSADEFLQEVFAATPPSTRVLWLKGDVKEKAASILGHPYPGLRIRYWERDDRTAWVLEEIGNRITSYNVCYTKLLRILQL